MKIKIINKRIEVGFVPSFDRRETMRGLLSLEEQREKNGYANGDVLEVVEMGNVDGPHGEPIIIFKCKCKDGSIVDISDKDCVLVDASPIIDWEQRTFDIAKELYLNREFHSSYSTEDKAEIAIDIAKKFIEGYKKQIAD